MTKVITQTYSIAMEYRARLTSAALVACMALGLVYSWNLYRVITATVALHQIEVRSTALSSGLDGLDAQYIALSDRVTPDALKAYGMSQAKVTEYISRSPSLGKVALGGHEF